MQGGFPPVLMLTCRTPEQLNSASYEYHLLLQCYDSTQVSEEPFCLPCSQVILTTILIVLNLLDELEELHSYRGNWKVVSRLRLLRGSSFEVAVSESDVSGQGAHDR